jgi:DNA-directed RNA polymerase II subunit RPB1
MMAHKARILPGKTFRLNLSVTTPYNADFDGDEMQLHVPQDYGTVTEVQNLRCVNKMIVSSQANRPIMGVIQDALLGVYLLTYPDVSVPRHQFMDCVFSAGEIYVNKMASFFQRAKKHYNKNLFNGRVLFSILLPEDFQFRSRNGACKEEPEVIIENGILIAGTVDKKIVGRSHGSIIHRLYKEYGCDRAAEFLSAVQFLVNRWLTYRGCSVGVADFLISEDNDRGVHVAIQKAYIEVQTIEESDDPELMKEFRINSALNNRGQSLAINGLCANNRLEVMIESGSKGSRMNIIQITGHLGQNNVEGRRIQFEIDDGGRTLPCFERGNKHPRTRGFIENSFLKGLTPAEFWFHAKAGREGVINTAVKTRDSGYAERKLVKRMEDLTVHLDHTVRNSVNNIISFSYGESLDPSQVYDNDGPSFVDIDNIVARLNADVPADPEDDESAEILYEVRNTERYNEVVQSVKEYRASIKVIKTKSGPVYKKMLNTARGKLKTLLAEKKELEAQQ